MSKFSFKAVSEYESERYLCSSSARSCCWPVLHALENLVHCLGAANSHNKKKPLWEQISPSLCVVVLGWSWEEYEERKLAEGELERHSDSERNVLASLSCQKRAGRYVRARGFTPPDFRYCVR